MNLKWLTPMDEDEFNVFWRTILPVNDLANSMRNYIRLTEQALREAVVRHEESEKISYTKADEEYRDLMEQAELDSRVEVECMFPSLAWSSIFQSVYALLEHEMIAIVSHMGAVQGITGHPEDNNKNKKGIYAAQLYLVEHFGMDPGKHRLWLELQTFYQIRNCFAHDRGVLGPSTLKGHELTRRQQRDVTVREYAEKHPDRLHVTSDGHVSLSKEFCIQALDTVETFLNQLIDEGRLWLGRWNKERGIEPTRTPREIYLLPWVPFAKDYR
jgi:hypothetical protein